MWYQDTANFLGTNFHISSLEGASFHAFRLHPSGKHKVLMTADWLDFSVTHLSKYVKHVSQQRDQQSIESLSEMMNQYIANVKSMDISQSHLAMNSTIAVLPLLAPKDAIDKRLVTLELTATLASLQSIGIGRGLIVGVSPAEKEVAMESFALLQNKTPSFSMELAFVPSLQQHKFVPQLALIGLQNAMKNATKEWLGKNPQRWKYVYFTEPDLLLHTRPSAVEAISKALNDGALLTAHRLEPVPHERHFPSLSRERIIPDIGVFAAIHTLNEESTCCDQGFYYPANWQDPTQMARVRNRGECRSLWPHCGFNRDNMDYHNHSVMLELHYRLLGYPFFTIADGLDVPLVGASQRVCVPSHDIKTCVKKKKQGEVS